MLKLYDHFSVSELLTGRCFDHGVCNLLPLETSEGSSFILFHKESAISVIKPHL